MKPASPRAAVFPALVITLLSGCAAEKSDPSFSWHRDVKPILQTRCANCHFEGGIGPFDLSNYATAKSVGSLIAHQVSTRAMPPWGAAPVRDYRFNPALSDTHIATIKTWVNEGMPEGSAGATPVTVDDNAPKLSRVDVTVKMPEVYTPKAQVDDYRCFILDWPNTQKGYVTGFAAKPGNLQVVHHVAAFLFNPGNGVDADTFAKLKELDDKEPGPGYTCFGGPTGDSGLLVPIQQLAQWVPGARGTDFPAGTGIEVLPGAKIVLQIHYNTANAGPLPDQTAIEMRVDATVDYPAAFAPWLNPVWPASPTSMKIPAGESKVIHQHVGQPIGFFKQFVGGVELKDGFDVHSVLLHMHELGKRADVTVLHDDGTETVLLDIPSYDFNWQRIYWLDKPVRVSKSDKLRVKCQWDNSEANQPTEANGKKKVADVTWGEGTHQEMCVANLYISEI